MKNHVALCVEQLTAYSVSKLKTSEDVFVEKLWHVSESVVPLSLSVSIQISSHKLHLFLIQIIRSCMLTYKHTHKKQYQKHLQLTTVVNLFSFSFCLHTFTYELCFWAKNNNTTVRYDKTFCIYFIRKQAMSDEHTYKHKL